MKVTWAQVGRIKRKQNLNLNISTVCGVPRRNRPVVEQIVVHGTCGLVLREQPLSIPAHPEVLLTDTVGFVQKPKPVEEGLSFPLILWCMDDNFSSDNDQIDPITSRRPQGISVESKGDETTTTSTQFSSLGKIIESLISTSQRLVRSVALNAHLSLLEISLLPIEISRSSCSISRRSSSSSFSKKFNVDEWLDCADLTRSGPSSLSNQNLLSIHREESMHSSIYGLPLDQASLPSLMPSKQPSRQFLCLSQILLLLMETSTYE